jgi:hypothetical protein
MDEHSRRIFSQKIAEALRLKDEEEAAERDRLRTPSRYNGSLGIDDEGAQWERLRSAYVELCHDYPIVSGGDDICHRLAKALIPRQSTSNLLIPSNDEQNSKKLALSSRVVNGVLQATARIGEKMTMSSPAQSGGNETERESMFGPSRITTSEGYAELAFAVFVEGLYRCIQNADNMQTASSFLGSFQPPDVSCDGIGAQDRSRVADEAAANIISGIESIEIEGKRNGQDDAISSPSSVISPPSAKKESKLTSYEDNDSLKEVFAEESDPDDFVYESSPSPYSGISYLQEIFGEKPKLDNFDIFGGSHELGFDPLKLSEPCEANRTFDGARKSIHYLLSKLSYGSLAFGSLSSRAWSQGGMSESLADLSFILLLEVSSRDQGDTGKPNSLLHPAHRDGLDASENDIATLWERPFFTLRDRALDENHGHDALPSFLQLIAAFLSHSEPKLIYSSPVAIGESLPVVVTVGISSLAMICSSKEMISASSGRMCVTSAWSVCPREEIKKSITSSLYSLTRILECTAPKRVIYAKQKAADIEKDESAQKKTLWIRIVVSIIQILEYLTNLQARFDFQPLFEGGCTRQTTLSKSDAQAVSDSGLFREMLSVYTATRNEEETSMRGKPSAKDVVRMQLLRTIFSLSTQSPEVLGKYAVRVPDFVKEIQSSTFMDNNLVDGILWASVGSSILEHDISDATNMPRLKLRVTSKSNSKGSPTETKSLADRSIAGFVTMCNLTKKALIDLKQCDLYSEEHNLGDEQKKKYDECKIALDDIKLLSNCFTSCPVVAAMWLGSLRKKEGANTEAKEQVADLKSILGYLPSFPVDEFDMLHPGHKKDDDVKNGESEEADCQKIQTIKQFRKDYRATVASVRSCVKVIALALESQQLSGSHSSSKTD